MSSTPVPDPVLVYTTFLAARNWSYFSVAVYVPLVYDWLLCLSDEYLYIHKARWTSIKVAFIICRYFPLFCWPYNIWAWRDHPREVCEWATQATIIVAPFMVLIPVLVFIIRAYAFAGRNKIFLVILISCWIALFVSYLWITITVFTGVLELQALFGRNSACIVTEQQKEDGYVTKFPQLVIYQICQLIFDTLMTGMIFFYAIRHRTRTMTSRLGKSFLIQSLGAYVVVLILHLLYTVAMAMAERQADGIMLLEYTLPNVIACRLILMLRRAGNPTRTMEDCLNLRRMHEAIARLPATADTPTTTDGATKSADYYAGDDDDDEDRNQPIEKWD